MLARYSRRSAGNSLSTSIISIIMADIVRMMSCFSLYKSLEVPLLIYIYIYISLAALSDDQVIVLQFVDNNPDIVAE